MPDVDPEKILKDLDAQLARLRANRARPFEERNAMRTKAWAVFCVVLVLVLWALQAFLSQIFPPRNPAVVHPPTASQDGKK